MTTTTAPTSHTIDVPGATLTYDVRAADSTEPPLLMIGSPMGASGFGTLASHFPDRTIVTYDPRGVERSPKVDPATESTPQQHAEDLHRVIEAIGGGPVDLFASSGGAVNALALVAAHPGDVRILVAHEPPLAALVPDREYALAASRAVGESYQAGGFGAGMARFIGVVSHQGAFDAGWLAQPAPTRPCSGCRPRTTATGRTRCCSRTSSPARTSSPTSRRSVGRPRVIVLAAGVGSGETLAARGARAAAERLGMAAVPFPSDHGGFLGGEYGQAGDPDAFAATLREVLAAS